MTNASNPAPLGVCKPDEALARLEGLVDVYSDVVTGFLNDDEGYVAKLREAVDCNDGASAHRTAHTVKGLASMCGAVSVAEACFQMEREAVKAATERRRELLRLIEAELAAARVGLAAYCRMRK